MPKLSESDILESIFTIIIGTVVSRGRADKSDVNAARALVEPYIFSSGKYEGSLAKDAKREKGSNPPDIFNVALSIRIKAQPDSKYKILYSSASEVGGLNDKIDQLIELASPFKMPQIAKILKARDRYLDNSTEDGITFNISADGSSGTNDAITGQVSVSMTAQTGEGSEPNDVIQETISFSLKSDQEDVESYNKMIAIANAFELNWKGISKFDSVRKKAITSSEKQKQSQILREMCDDLIRMISQNKVDASRRIYEFLRQAENLVDVSSKAASKLEEVSDMQKSVTLSVFQSGRNVTIKDARKSTTVFVLKTIPRFGEIDFRLE